MVVVRMVIPRARGGFLAVKSVQSVPLGGKFSHHCFLHCEISPTPQMRLAEMLVDFWLSRNGAEEA